MKKYLLSITTPTGAIISIGYYCDTPSKNYRIYMNGSDMGSRFEYLGNAARELERVLKSHRAHGVTAHILKYGTKNDVIRRGSNA